MKKNQLLFILFMFLSIDVFGQGTFSLPANDASCRNFVNSSFAMFKTPPFYFEYGGKPSTSFLKLWRFYKEEKYADGETVVRYNWLDPKTELKVVCEVKLFDDFNAMEWMLSFVNTSRTNTPQICDVRVVDLNLASALSSGQWQLYSADGSTGSIGDFQPRTTDLESGKPVMMSPNGGRSSDGVLPFFNVRTPSGGAVFAIGWSGNWKAEIERSRNSVRVVTGMKSFDAYLEPGEEIRMPSTAVVFWQGDDRMDGQNKFRQFVLAHHFPKENGKPAEFPLCSGFNWGDPAPCNEYSCLTALYARALIERSQLFGIVPDCFWLDAGWYIGSSDWENGRNWANCVGNWVVDKGRFPLGLGEVSDAAHEAGSKFMVWFEPERVMNNSLWARMHPEYMLTKSGKKAEPLDAGEKASETFLLDLGNKDALTWLCGTMEILLKDNRIDYYRQDFNMEPEAYWKANDKPFRKGICEARYVAGLYKYWDYLRTRFPGMLIDNCASGGRRLDLETTSRSVALWRTDYQYGEPTGAQCHTYGLCQWLPVHGTGTMRGDAYCVRSALSGTLALNWKTTSPDTGFLDMRRRVAEYKAVQPYFKADFYPLTGYDGITRDDIWLAYQLHRSDDNSGYIVAFRRDKSSESEYVLHLHGMVPDYVYVFEDQNTGECIELTGKEIANGMHVHLDSPHSSLLVRYKRK